MDQDESIGEPVVDNSSVGARLRETRLAKGLELDDVAGQTRIPLRHLESIEAGRFGDLPSRTYAIGFTRTYARLLDLDERPLLDDVRAELADSQMARPATPAKFEPGDPARVPGRGLAWFALLAAVLLIGGIYAFYSSYFAPGLGPAPLQDPAQAGEQAEGEGAQATPTPASPTGPVVFTNEMEGTWVRFYDGEGESLFEGTMDVGDTFTVPDDADNPQIRTGRPYAFAITVGGRALPKLSEEDEVISDVPITAEALLARGDAEVAEAEPSAPAATATTTD